MADTLRHGILSVDLAYKCYRDIGVVALRTSAEYAGQDRPTGGGKTSWLPAIHSLLLVDVAVDTMPNHDQLQAIVAGLAGLEVASGNSGSCEFAGIGPFVEEGIWREGWIVNRKPK